MRKLHSLQDTIKEKAQDILWSIENFFDDLRFISVEIEKEKRQDSVRQYEYDGLFDKKDPCTFQTDYRDIL